MATARSDLLGHKRREAQRFASASAVGKTQAAVHHVLARHPSDAHGSPRYGRMNGPKGFSVDSCRPKGVHQIIDCSPPDHG
jgi:hypothetical protein